MRAAEDRLWPPQSPLTPSPAGRGTVDAGPGPGRRSRFVEAPDLLQFSPVHDARSEGARRQGYDAPRGESDGAVSYYSDYTGVSDRDDAPRRGSLAHLFFGFLYDSDSPEEGDPHARVNDEEDSDGEEDGEELDFATDDWIQHPGFVRITPSSSARRSGWCRHWNALNSALFAALWFQSLATTVPVTLMSVVAALPQFQDDVAAVGAAGLAPRAASAAVLGTALGKVLNGPVGDIAGARRTTLLYTGLLVTSLLGLAAAQTDRQALAACFAIEFFASVQWPCCIVILATHYKTKGPHSSGRKHQTSARYEGGVYVTSLASRLGALVGIPAGALLLRCGVHWRLVAAGGAWMALVGAAVTYLHVQDAPAAEHQAQNPVDPQLLTKWFPAYAAAADSQRTSSFEFDPHHPQFGVPPRCQPRLTFGLATGLAWFVVRHNVAPSLRRVLRSGTFWSVALAHAGSSVIRTSERVLATYLADTSEGTLGEGRAAGLAVFLSVGIVAGLVVAGGLFARRTERQRKRLVARLYLLTIAACYLLAFLAVPAVRRTAQEPGMITLFQTLAVVAAGFGIAVPLYHIPSLVGATFGRDKGLFSAFTDALAYGVASILWRIVGRAVANGNPDGGGWAYGWAAVALLLIPSSVLMVEFMEHFFCRQRNKGFSSYETIIFA